MDIPKSLRNSESIYNLFNKLFPNQISSVVMIKDNKEYSKLVKEHDQLLISYNAAKELYNNNISDDDQHVLLRCFLKRPDMFQLFKIGLGWPKALTTFQITE